MPASTGASFDRYKNVTEIETYFPRLPTVFYSIRVLAWIPRLLKKVRALVPLETYWDQVVVPRVLKQHGVDVVFNPHLTIPIRGRFGKVMILHNVEYHLIPKVYNWRMYTWWFLLEHKIMPAADRVISLSHAMTADFRKYVKYPIAQVRTIYHGVSEKFRAWRPTQPGWRAPARSTVCPSASCCLSGVCILKSNFVTLRARLCPSQGHDSP